jgi:hypothetical protein
LLSGAIIHKKVCSAKGFYVLRLRSAIGIVIY